MQKSCVGRLWQFQQPRKASQIYPKTRETHSINVPELYLMSKEPSNRYKSGAAFVVVTLQWRWWGNVSSAYILLSGLVFLTLPFQTGSQIPNLDQPTHLHPIEWLSVFSVLLLFPNLHVSFSRWKFLGIFCTANCSTHPDGIRQRMNGNGVFMIHEKHLEPPCLRMSSIWT
jgi:hypothetical protein